MKRLQKISILVRVVATLAIAALPTVTALADTDIQGPLTSSVVLAPNPATLGSSATVTATVDDSTTGGSNIQSAEYSLDGGVSWTAMSASDGIFDTATENVTATFTATQTGDNQVCVRGTDVANNIGTETCAAFTVESVYSFKGFLRPVHMGVVNKAKAGRTIPLKWFLYLSTDQTPVSDKSSFVAVKSYEVDCTTLSGDPSTAVVEKSPGKSGLKYLENGKWKFNWKTIKSYSGTCRNVFVLFSDGSMSPEVLYRFR